MAQAALAPAAQYDEPEGQRIEERLHPLSELAVGWYDGEDGPAYSRDGLLWLAEAWLRHVPASLPMPAFGPTLEGLVHVEWPTRPWDVSLEIDTVRRTADFHALHLPTDEVREKDGIELGSDLGWEEFVQLLGPLVGDGR